MRLQFVSCGDAFGSGGRSNTCFHLTGAQTNLLIDCGASSLPALKRLGIAPDDIDLMRPRMTRWSWSSSSAGNTPY